VELEKIPVEKAVGRIIGHDLTQIIPGQYKGPRFKKGDIIKKDDIPVLKDMGKEYIYIIKMDEGYLHEEEAAERIARVVTGKGITMQMAGEGKIVLKAEYQGLLKIDLELLYAANRVKDVLITAANNNTPVNKDDSLAGVRVNPLVISEKIILEVRKCL